MNWINIVSITLVLFVGFAAHRASLCTVRAVAELFTSSSAHMLVSFARAAAWTVGGGAQVFVTMRAFGGAVPHIKCADHKCTA